MKKKVVALVVLDYDKKGGIERYVKELAKGLSQRCLVHIFTNSLSRKNVIENPKIIFHKIPIINIHPAINTLQFCLLVSLRLIFSRFDIIHNHCAGLFIPSISTFHSVHIKTFKKHDKKFISKVLAWLLAIIYKDKDIKKFNVSPGGFIICLLHKIAMLKRNRKGVITHNKDMTNEIAKFYKIEPNQINVIPPGINHNIFNLKDKYKIRRNIRQKLGILEDEFVLIFVSNRFKEKNLDVVIKAIELVKVKLIVAGNDDKKPYIKLCKDLQIIDYVKFINSVSNIEDYYKAADVIIHPAPWGWFELVCLEAMACGVVVLATKVYGIKDYLKDGVNGYFIEANVESIVEKLKVLINNKHLLEKMKKEAHKTALLYNWETTVNRTYEVYERLPSFI
jgi:glycosyltransferase involved in cell wall biosynthesis